MAAIEIVRKMVKGAVLCIPQQKSYIYTYPKSHIVANICHPRRIPKCIYIVAYHFLDNQNLDCKKLSPKNSFISSKPRNEVVPKNWHIEHFFYTWWRDVKLKCPDWSSCSDFHHPIYRYKNNRNSLTQYNAQVLQELSYKKIFKDYSILSLTGLWQQIFNIWVSIHLYYQ